MNKKIFIILVLTMIMLCVSACGTVPDELEYIPDGYENPATQQGTLNKLTYDTWESFSYEQKSNKITKEAWVYLPYGYTDEEEYNVLYLSHGGWSNETTLMGTDDNPKSFKNVIDNAITLFQRWRVSIVHMQRTQHHRGLRNQETTGVLADFQWGL